MLFQIPVDRHGKLRSSEHRCGYASSHSKILELADVTGSADKKLIEQTPNNAYASLIPKMSLNLEKVVEQNPRILDLREKLNEITKKQNRSVDKKTKGLINDITQQLVDEKDVDESGPYSLLLDLQTNPSSSRQEISEGNSWTPGKESVTENFRKSTTSINKNSDRLPNVINFDDKPMREFEYSCETDFPVKKTFNTHSRSDLCLQLKSHVHTRPFESNLSPNDNSLSRTNEENSLDDSLGILTPDQMDDMCYLENTFSPTVEGLPIFCDNTENKISPENGDTPSTDKTESNSAASTIQNDVFENDDSKQCELVLPIDKQETIDEHQNLVTALENYPGYVCCETPCDPKKAIQQINSVSQSLNEHFQENDEIALIKEELMPLMDEEFMPSIHSSILEPVSSIAETTVNLEIPLDCKHESRVVVNRIEQTPSPEDLPLDSSDINGEISTYSQFSASTLHDSQTYSENSKNDYPKSMETSKVSNSFITSITSITSLDGYQGDGEMSRPVSRGADHSIDHREDVIEMDWQNVPVTRRADPMTDSDFFTESDADGLDDNVQRGDRRAQVIDGALYGGKNGNGNAPLIVNRNDDSCMDSSGVYTDFENHRSSPVFLNVIDDMSPEGSTPSTHSECSQKNSSNGKPDTYFAPLQNALNEQKSEVSNMENEDGISKNTSKRSSLNSVKEIRTNEKNKEEKRSFTLKKYKMPKRDVPSKLKTMLANRKADVDTSVQSSPKAVKKTDRRETFLKKNSIELKSDNKTKTFKDIKSKVDCSFSLQRSQTACSVTRMLSSKSTNVNAKPKRLVVHICILVSLCMYLNTHCNYSDTFLLRFKSHTIYSRPINTIYTLWL